MTAMGQASLGTGIGAEPRPGGILSRVSGALGWLGSLRIRREHANRPNPPTDGIDLNAESLPPPARVRPAVPAGTISTALPLSLKDFSSLPSARRQEIMTFVFDLATERFRQGDSFQKDERGKRYQMALEISETSDRWNLLDSSVKRLDQKLVASILFHLRDKIEVTAQKKDLKQVRLEELTRFNQLPQTQKLASLRTIQKVICVANRFGSFWFYDDKSSRLGETSAALSAILKPHEKTLTPYVVRKLLQTYVGMTKPKVEYIGADSGWKFPLSRKIFGVFHRSNKIFVKDFKNKQELLEAHTKPMRDDDDSFLHIDQDTLKAILAARVA